jgi:hypothetical protein
MDMPECRVSTVYLENFDDPGPGRPSLAERIALMRPQIVRLRTDPAFSGGERPGASGPARAVRALEQLLLGTNPEGANFVSTRGEDGAVFDERNLVVTPVCRCWRSSS